KGAIGFSRPRCLSSFAALYGLWLVPIPASAPCRLGSCCISIAMMRKNIPCQGALRKPSRLDEATRSGWYDR
ncbi:MAG: hypothetical protein WBC84_13580, partial [Pseudolabrys sp.]